MDIQIHPSALRGRVEVPASKSAAHRALVCSLLAEGVSSLTPYQPLRDVQATEGGIRALGAKTSRNGPALLVQGGGPLPEAADVDCDECAATLRFLLPVSAALGVPTHFYRRGRLPVRPIAALVEELARHGATVHTDEDGALLSLSGRLRHGVYHLPGDVSSQFVSGLLFALPLLEAESELHLTAPLESKGYVQMTIDVLAAYGIAVEPVPGGFRVPGGQKYQPSHYTLEGDYSAAAFWLCANALGSDIGVTGLPAETRQGDRAVVDLLRRMAPVAGRDFMEIDVSQIPDLLPALAAVAAFSETEVCFRSAARLRLKESDRIRAMAAGLTAIGGNVREYSDMLVVTGSQRLHGGVSVGAFGDHRVAMAMSIAALRCDKPVTILGAECVGKSYPAFYEDFRALGGDCRVL